MVIPLLLFKSRTQARHVGAPRGPVLCRPSTFDNHVSLVNRTLGQTARPSQIWQRRPQRGMPATQRARPLSTQAARGHPSQEGPHHQDGNGLARDPRPLPIGAASDAERNSFIVSIINSDPGRAAIRPQPRQSASDRHRQYPSC
jgi:hypothetical protein